MENQITLTFTDYVITGTAYITLWGGEKGSITMNPFHVKELPEDLTELPFNDAGFGCESIDSVSFEISKNFQGHIVLHENGLELTLSKDANTKRGI